MRPGYTLVEVVVVALLVALAASVVAPSIGKSVDSFRLRAEVAGVGSFLRAARERAITRDTAYEVAIDPGKGTFAIRAVKTEQGSDPGPVLATKQLSPRIRIATEPTDPHVIGFSPQGLSTGGRFRIESPGVLPYVIAIDPLTGRVSIQRGGP